VILFDDILDVVTPVGVEGTNEVVFAETAEDSGPSPSSL